MSFNWADTLDDIKNYMFKIKTPQGSGSGFLIMSHENNNLYSIATAYHVIEHACLWREPLIIQNAVTNNEIFLCEKDRVIFPNPQNDVAIILVKKDDRIKKMKPPSLVPSDKFLKSGNELGWIGYPAIAPDELSFFCGYVSCYLIKEKAYLVDGVAINGVSGGPAFIAGDENNAIIVGLISAYIPNRVTGETLPGVCFVSDIEPCQSIINKIKSFEEAREKKSKESDIK